MSRMPEMDIHCQRYASFGNRTRVVDGQHQREAIECVGQSRTTDRLAQSVVRMPHTFARVASLRRLLSPELHFTVPLPSARKSTPTS